MTDPVAVPLPPETEIATVRGCAVVRLDAEGVTVTAGAACRVYFAVVSGLFIKPGTVAKAVMVAVCFSVIAEL
jgi:cystathionine beta-lyase family protein involved in aluminum resistance